MTVSNNDLVIDSRDVIEEIAQLRESLEAASGKDCGDFGGDAGWLEYCLTCDDCDHEEVEKLTALVNLQDQCECYSEWTYGEQLIHSSHWVDYVQELIKDCGELPRNIPSYIEIDWEATADNVEWDYERVNFDGEEYLIRSV